MNIDPLLESFLAGYSFDPPASIAEERAQEVAFNRSLVGTLVNPVPTSVRIHDETIGGPDESSPVGVRIYTPEGDRTRAALVFAHGGGWVTGSIETAHEHCGTLAHDADTVVISVEYRLAPEHPYPAGVDDFSYAVGWVHTNAERLGIDPDRIAVGGESAGGNLAAVAALRARDQNGPHIALQLLEVPVLDLTLSSPSYQDVEAQFPFLAEAATRTMSRYATGAVDPHDPYVSPLFVQDLSNLPPAVLLACEVDPVRDDSARYADRLTAAGVPARAQTFPGLIHGTENLTAALPAAAEWHTVCVEALRSL